MIRVTELASNTYAGQMQGNLAANAAKPIRDRVGVGVTASQFPNQVDPSFDSYFVETTEGNTKRKTFALGWDHAVLIERLGDTYCVRSVWCHGQKRFRGKLEQVPSPLPQAKQLQIGNFQWTYYVFDNPIPIDEVITFGVTSCSFTVTFSATTYRWVCISHINGSPSIPNLAIMNRYSRGDRIRGVASVWPCKTEMDKFDPLDGGANLTLALRGKEPSDSQADNVASASFYHMEIGVNLKAADNPKLIGTFGLLKDTDYYELIGNTDGALYRIKSFGVPESFSQNLIFPIGNQEMKQAIRNCNGQTVARKLREEYGYPTGPLVLVKQVQSSYWQIISLNRVIDVKELNNGLVSAYSSTEAQDLVTDVIKPLQNGARGFQAIHNAVLQGVVQKFGTNVLQHSYVSLFDDELTSFERLVKAEAAKLNGSTRDRTIYARMVGHMYSSRHPDQHAYASIITAQIRTHRYRMDIPLSMFAFG